MISMPIFNFPKVFKMQEKLFAKYRGGKNYYYGQIQTIENGFADFVFFDGVREWISTNDLIKVEDILKEGSFGANWNKQGVYYPCALGSLLDNQSVEVVYGDGQKDIMRLCGIRISKER